MCLVIASMLGGWTTESRSSILVFDQTRVGGVVVPTGSGGDIPLDYGDRVTGLLQSVPGGTFTYGEAGEGFTPNVVVDFFSIAPGGANDTSLWTEFYGDLRNVVFGNQSSNTLNVRLTADTGFSALLYGFELAGWPNADYTINAVRVLDGTTTVFEALNVLVEGDFVGPRHTTFAFASPLSGGDLLIEIDYGNIRGNQQDNIGIDNIRFGQFPQPAAPPPSTTVPEPSSILVFGIAFSTFALLVRRSRVPPRA